MMKKIVFGLIITGGLFLAGCEQNNLIDKKVSLSGDVVVETGTEKVLQKAIPVDLTNMKVEYQNLGKIWTEKTTAIALDMEQFLFSGDDHSKICSYSCGGDYWYNHSIDEGPGDICENYWTILPEYGIKVFSWGWAGKEAPQKEKIVNNNSIIILDNSDGHTRNETISLYKIPSGQSFKQTLEKTRPETKSFEKYEKKEIHSNNGGVNTWYDGFGKNINNKNSEDFEIYQGGDNESGGNKIFLWFREQENIFFVYDNYDFEMSFPTCPSYLIDTI